MRSRLAASLLVASLLAACGPERQRGGIREADRKILDEDCRSQELWQIGSSHQVIARHAAGEGWVPDCIPMPYHYAVGIHWTNADEFPSLASDLGSPRRLVFSVVSRSEPSFFASYYLWTVTFRCQIHSVEPVEP